MIGRADEIDPQQIGVIAVIGVEETVRDARDHDVADEQELDREAENDLAQLGNAQPQCPPLPQRVKRQRVMSEEADEEQQLGRWARPDQENLTKNVLHCL